MKCYKEPQIVGDSCLCEKGWRRKQRSRTVAGNEAGEIGSDPSVPCPRNYAFLKCLGVELEKEFRWEMTSDMWFKKITLTELSED